MFRFPAFAPAFALLLLPAAAPAQTAPGVSSNADEQAQSGQPPKRIRDVTLSAGQPCPKAQSGDEVVVCRQLEDPYRIPKPLRNNRVIAPHNQSWVNRTDTMDEIGRKAGGLPDTCSPVGSGGQTGCTSQMLRNWTAEQRLKRNGQPVDDQ
ncbi:MAG: hypothetical protein M3R41_01115 [Pseudomonadota bacterium]|nr:hypothetical protein [Pseudomonadota bacterium]